MRTQNNKGSISASRRPSFKLSMSSSALMSSLWLTKGSINQKYLFCFLCISSQIYLQFLRYFTVYLLKGKLRCIFSILKTTWNRKVQKPICLENRDKKKRAFTNESSGKNVDTFKSSTHDKEMVLTSQRPFSIGRRHTQTRSCHCAEVTEYVKTAWVIIQVGILLISWLCIFFINVHSLFIIKAL